MKIGNLFIGYTDGKKEALYKPDFEQFYFNYNGLYEKILKPDKFLLLGRKGTGKTILGEYIKKKSLSDSNWFCELTSYRSFKFHEMKTLKSEDIKPNEYTMIWEWIILIKIATQCVKDEFIDSNIREQLKDFLETSFFELDLNANKIVEITKKNEVNASILYKILNLGGKYGKDTKYQKGTYVDYLPSLRKTILKALKTSNSRYTIIFDELDDQFRDEDLYKSNIISLIKTTEKLNIYFHENQIDCKIIILLRTDIFYILNDADLNKIEYDNSVKIDWGINYGPDSHLFEMILLKIRQSIDFKESNKKLYNKFFPSKISIGNREISLAKFILSRTYLRPRDIVSYLNLIREDFPNNEVFSVKSIKKIERKYSGYLLKELRNELYGHMNETELKESILLLTQYKKASFKYSDIKEYYIERKSIYSNINLERMLKIFFDFSIIGNRWHNKRGGKKETYYSFAFRENNAVIDFDKEFNIHLGLRKEFNI